MPDPTPLKSEVFLPEQSSQETLETGEQNLVTDEVVLEEGIEEELIIEDFTIDGICGVY